MDAFETHSQILSDYREYLKSFLRISDDLIREEVESAFESGGFIPEPLVQFNPSFQKGDSLESLANQGLVHKSLHQIFGAYDLYKHQVEALKIGIQEKGFIVTSGTGSGKSLTYLATIFNYLLKLPKKEKGVKAILVYPMNALINSQEEEINKFRNQYGEGFPITYAVYTGQQDNEARERIRNNPPDIILTNYMMLELIMTRHAEDWLRDSLKEYLQFLVFDELHTYRGRQGSDVSLLIRRIKHHATKEVISIGTSATMASDGTVENKKHQVAKVASTIFGAEYHGDQIIGEYLERVTYNIDINPLELSELINTPYKPKLTEEALRKNPLANWLESSVVLKDNGGPWKEGYPKPYLK